MSKYISIYGNNPTAGKTDGTAISEGGSYTNPLSVTLDATKNEAAYIKCAVRCVTGYSTVGDTVIAFDGSSKEKWSVAEDHNFTAETAKGAIYRESLTISDSIDSTNTIFWVKVEASEDEEPSNDKNTQIMMSTKIQAVEE